MGIAVRVFKAQATATAFWAVDRLTGLTRPPGRNTMLYDLAALTTREGILEKPGYYSLEPSLQPLWDCEI